MARLSTKAIRTEHASRTARADRRRRPTAAAPISALPSFPWWHVGFVVGADDVPTALPRVCASTGVTLSIRSGQSGVSTKD